MWYFKHHARRIIRNSMKPISPDVAKKWLIRVRVMYFTLAVACFSFAYYNYTKNKEVLDPIKELDPTSSHRLMRLKGEPGTVKILRINMTPGMSNEYYEYDNQKYIEEYNAKAEQLKAELREKHKDKLATKESN